MARFDVDDATARAMRALALYGSPRKGVRSRKYTVSSTITRITLPVLDVGDAQGEQRPTFIKFNIPAGVTALYVAWGPGVDGDATVPTTGADGVGELVDDQTIICVWTQTRMSLIAEGTGDVTISYIW